MSLAFVLDEQMHGFLLKMIRHHNARGRPAIDAVQVGDPPDLPRQSSDPDILLGAEREGRLVVSRDNATMPGHFRAHLRAGHHSPGLLMIRAGTQGKVIVDWLALITRAGDPTDYADQIEYIP